MTAFLASTEQCRNCFFSRSQGFTSAAEANGILDLTAGLKACSTLLPQPV
jgi:hypothetical protein